MKWKPMVFYHLKTRMIVVYSMMFVATVLVAGMIIYTSLRQSIIRSTDDSLTAQIQLIRDMIETTAQTSARSYFRATAYSGKSSAAAMYDLYRKGELTEQEAKRIAWEAMAETQVGPSGYTYILNHSGVVLYHPKPELIGVDVTENDFVRKQINQREGYLEYRWQNPGETEPRDKALYMTYFEPWDWIISTSGYRNELMNLINISDFEKQVLNIHFLKTGYSTVLDYSGTFLIHPTYKGRNFVQEKGPMGDVIREGIAKKNARIEYWWKNPGETKYRKKVTIVSDIPEFQLLVASTAYEEEFLEPLGELQRRTAAILTGALILVVILTLKISQSITKPIVLLKQSIDRAASGDLDVQIVPRGEDEVGDIAKHFNFFVASLNSQRTELDMQLEQNREANEMLVALNENLEVLVSERTQELQKSLEELRQTQKRLIEEERFAYLGRLIAKVAHYLNTPIGTAVTTVSFIKQELKTLLKGIQAGQLTRRMLQDHSENMMESADVLEGALEHTIQVMESFKLLQIMPDESRMEEVALSYLLNDLRVALRDLSIPEQVDFMVTCPEELKVKTYPEVLRLVLRQLVSNALNHAFIDSANGIIRISVKQVVERVVITFEDNGAGIPPESLPLVFEPFYSGGYGVKNVGLGLNIAHNAVVKNLKGTIACSSSPGEGTRFVIEIPSDVSGEG